MDGRRRGAGIATLAGLVIAALTLLFGDNIYQQLTGHSIYRDVSTSEPTIPAVAYATETALSSANTPALVPTSAPPTPTPECFRTTELGPWPTPGNILIDARDGWVQADFWSPARVLMEGYDEVSVIFEPGLEVEVVGVAGNGWEYSIEWTRQDVEFCTMKHINDSWNIRRRRLVLISVTELCAITVCR